MAARLVCLMAALGLSACAGMGAPDEAGDVYGLSEERTGAGAEAPAVFMFAKDGATIAVFGTTHLIPAALKWMSPATEAALSQAELILTETSMLRRDEVEISPEQAADLAPRAEQPPGGSFFAAATERLGWDAAERIEAALEANELDPGAYDGKRPWVICRDLQIPTKLRTRITDQDRALITDLSANFGPPDIAPPDLKVELYGASNGIPALFLESEYQRALNFSRLSDAAALDCAAQLTGRTVRGSGDLVAEYRALLALWTRGDVERARLMIEHDQSAISPDWSRLFLQAREMAWLGRIQRLCDEARRNCFIAVGMGHLGGSDGLLRGIERLGYRPVQPQG